MKRIITSLIVLFAVLIPGTARAAQSSQTQVGISVTPFLQNISINPNQPTTKFDFFVTNQAKVARTFKLSIIDFGTLDETGGIAFTGSQANNLSQAHGLSKWLSINQPELSLNPEQKVSVTATIDNQPSLSPGGHYAAIVINAQAANASGKNSVGLRQTVTSLVFATKLGGVKYDLKLAGVTQNGNLFHPPTKVVLRFYNPGNVHIVPRGIVKLMRGNKVVSQGVINEDSDYILPGTYRQIFVDMHKISSVPSVRLVNTYKMEVNYRYDGYNQFATKTYTVRLISGWTIGLGGVIIVAVVWLGLYSYRKRVQLKAIQKEFQKRWLAMYARISFVRPMKKTRKKKIHVKIEDE